MTYSALTRFTFITFFSLCRILKTTSLTIPFLLRNLNFRLLEILLLLILLRLLNLFLWMLILLFLLISIRLNKFLIFRPITQITLVSFRIIPVGTIWFWTLPISPIRFECYRTNFNFSF